MGQMLENEHILWGTKREEKGVDDGQLYQAVADRTGISFWTVRKWVHRVREAAGQHW